MIRVVVDDLAFVTADALVRPATSRLEPVSPALRRLEQVGGAAFWSQLRVRQELAVGAAVVTSGGDLSVPFVIHAIISSVSEPVTATGVRRAIRSSLQRATDWELGRLGIPLIGTGPGGLAHEQAAEILCDELGAHLGSVQFPTDISIVVEREDERNMVEARLSRDIPNDPA